ncbi:MAG: flap endonuclease-1 [Candidatus Nezhaarchaeales archaeon]
MGVDLADLVPKRVISLSDLSGKALAIDAYNALHQFIAIIRQPDGTPLKDRLGRITSHLSGLFYRTVNLIELGIKPVYVFDGKPPELKEFEIIKRMRQKEEALKKYEEAMAMGDLKLAKTYAQQTGRLTEEMVKESKTLLDFMGVPWVQAPSEGEAQAALMAVKGDVYAVASQDYDSLLFGAPRLVRNLTISGRRKLPRKEVYVEVAPELIELAGLLKELGITREQLIDIGILVGTDFNPEGVRGIGPKKALKLIKEYGTLKNLLPNLKEAVFPVEPSIIERIFLNPEVSLNYKLDWREPNREGIVKLLCGEYGFSEERVVNAVNRALKAFREAKSKVTLEAFFKSP